MFLYTTVRPNRFEFQKYLQIAVHDFPEDPLAFWKSIKENIPKDFSDKDFAENLIKC